MQKPQTAPHHHQAQYNEYASEFFDHFNKDTWRPTLFYGFITGCVQVHRYSSTKNKRVALDIGSGTGWLVNLIANHGFARVYGLDSSEDMIRVATKKNQSEIMAGKILFHHKELPTEIFEKCDLVTAIHTHYHFQPKKKLEENFFGLISKTLKPGGQAIIIGTPSDFISQRNPHYFNSIHVRDLPIHIRKNMFSCPDKDGYIPLTEVFPFPLRDGTQLRVTLTNPKRQEKSYSHLSLIDTFWKDSTLISAAKKVGLTCTNNEHLGIDGSPHAYLALRFIKQKRNGTISLNP
jgi:SAM-dependent methyltransferase